MKLLKLTFLFAVFLLPFLAKAQQPDGERLFKQRCATCHSLDPDKNTIAPSLANVLNQPAARIEDARYSDALAQSGLVWDTNTLEAFLADPGKLVPGTRMNVRVPSREQRAAIIDFLSSAQ